MKRPLVSVITVTYNAAATLEATINSVLSQDRDLFEYWIIDGNSKDSTTDIIRKYESDLAGWISESDKGIYDAMNKGIDRATGDWLYFLGSDDTLSLNSLSQINPHLTAEYVAVYGSITFDDGRLVNSFFSSRTLLQNTIHHQATFYKRGLFSDFRYDKNLLILSDYELNLRIYTSGMNCLSVPIVVATCGLGGASSNLDISLKETNHIRAKYVQNKLVNVVLSKSLWLYYLQKKIRSALFGN